MTTRVYVGARYVPKLDDEYNAEKVYEPLTTVYYNGSTYTSKKNVPAGVTPNNSEYWMFMGSGGGSQGVEELKAWKSQTVEPFMRQTTSDVSGLQDDVSNINSEITHLHAKDADLQDDVSNINSEITHLHAKDADLQNQINNISPTGSAKRKFLFVGDSYMIGTTSTTAVPENLRFGTLFKNRMRLENDQFQQVAANGAGFISTPTFLIQLTTKAGTMTTEEKDGITDIVVLGGWNDRNETTSNLVTAITNFINYANTNFKNAVVHIGMISASKSDEFITERINLMTVKGAYYKPTVDSGSPVSFIQGINDCLKINPAYLENEGAQNHPNEYGHKEIARGLISYFCGGSPFTEIGSIRNQPSISGMNGVTITGANNTSERVSNGQYLLDLGNDLITFEFGSATPQGGAAFNIAQLSNQIIRGMSRFISATPSSLIIRTARSGANKYYPASGFFYIEGNKIVFMNTTLRPDADGFMTINSGDALLVRGLQFKGMADYI